MMMMSTREQRKLIDELLNKKPEIKYSFKNGWLRTTVKDLRNSNMVRKQLDASCNTTNRRVMMMCNEEGRGFLGDDQGLDYLGITSNGFEGV